MPTMSKNKRIASDTTVYTKSGVFRAGDDVPAAVAEHLDPASLEAAPAHPNIPPMGGAGSGIEPWRDYADKLEVQVPEDAKRDDIVEAIRAAGHPVETDQ